MCDYTSQIEVMRKKAEAEELKKKLEEAGGKVTLKSTNYRPYANKKATYGRFFVCLTLCFWPSKFILQSAYVYRNPWNFI